MISLSNRLAPLIIIAFWLVVMAMVYTGITHFSKAKPQVVSSLGELVLTRERDGHFYADGDVNGQSVRFLVDTGASLVVIDQALANRAGLDTGEPMIFNTANGQLKGYAAPNAVVRIGPLTISNIRVGVGLNAGFGAQALLGQNFLSKFDVSISGQEMILRKR